MTVDVDGTRADVLEADLDALRSAPPHEGTHLLAAYDPWLANGDRTLVLPDRDHQKQVWRSIHSPGVVLVNGTVVATWKARLTADRLTIDVTALAQERRRDLDQEAERIARLRGATRTSPEVIWKP